MPITISCPSCKKQLTIGDAAAGKRGKCPHCKGMIVVPSSAPPTPRSDSTGVVTVQARLVEPDELIVTSADLVERPVTDPLVADGTSPLSRKIDTPNANEAPPTSSFLVRFSISLIPLVVFLAGIVLVVYWFAFRESLSPEELLVKNHLLEQANDPSSTEFVKWGPHGNAKEKRVIRVIVRGKNALGIKIANDVLFLVKDGKIAGVKVNDWGDNWNGKARFEGEK